MKSTPGLVADYSKQRQDQQQQNENRGAQSDSAVTKMK
jgi:hypothetical protein